MSAVPPDTASTPGPAAPARDPVSPTRLREDLIHPDPLLDCLVEVCRLHGQAASRASLSAGLPLVDGRLSLGAAHAIASKLEGAIREEFGEGESAGLKDLRFDTVLIDRDRRGVAHHRLRVESAADKPTERRDKIPDFQLTEAPPMVGAF